MSDSDEHDTPRHWVVLEGSEDAIPLGVFERQEDAEAAIADGFGEFYDYAEWFPAGRLPEMITLWQAAVDPDGRIHAKPTRVPVGHQMHLEAECGPLATMRSSLALTEDEAVEALKTHIATGHDVPDSPPGPPPR